MRLNNLVIAFEGLDGTGKTLFSSLISDELDKRDVSNKRWPIDSLGTITPREMRDADLSYAYYLKAIRTRLAEAPREVLIFDRYLPSALGYKNLRKSSSSPMVLAKSELNKLYQNIVKPDLTIVLHSSEKIRRERIFSKTIVDQYDIDSLETKNRDYWQGFYSNIVDDSVLFFDTAGNKEDITREILKEILSVLHIKNRNNRHSSFDLYSDIKKPNRISREESLAV